MSSICLINGVLSPHVNGGAENYVLRTARALQARGHDISIITTKPYDSKRSLRPEREMYQGVPVYRFYPLNHSHRSNGTGETVATKALWHQFDTYNPHAARVVRKILEDLRPDVVHTNNFMGISTSVGRVIEAFDTRYVHMLHDYSLLCPKSSLLRERTLPGDQIGVCRDPPTPCRLYAKANEKTVGTPDRLVAPSQHVIDIHRSHGWFPDVPASRIEHGVDRVVETPPDPPAEPSVLYAGKHQRSKGLETLFSAAEELSDVTIHLCGSGPLEDRSAAVADANEAIQHHGFVSEARLDALRREVSAAVVPSIWMENSPLVIYESFAAGLPVIGADRGGIPELIEPGVRGELFPAADERALRGAIRTVTEPNRARRLGQNALEWAREHRLERHVDRLLECYGLE